MTPKQIKNLQDETQGDLEYLDGYPELSEELQQKVKQALDDGHVADEDWKHGM